MPHIVLTEEQARVVAEATSGVELRNPQGQVLAYCTPLLPGDADLIAECKRRLADQGPRVPAARVRAMLQQLQELANRGEATPERIAEIRRRTKAGEPL